MGCITIMGSILQGGHNNGKQVAKGPQKAVSGYRGWK